MCFSNLIGIRGRCTDVTPSSGLYIQDLTGLTIANAEAAIDEDRQSGIALLDEKITLAVSHVKNELWNFISPKIRPNSLVDNEVIGIYQNDMPVLAAEAGLLKGIHIKIDSTPYAELFISTLRLQAQSSGNVDVKVYDLLQNKLLDTITVAAVAGEIIETEINKTYLVRNKRLHLFIGHSADAYKSTITYAPSCTTCGSNGYNSRYIWVNGSSLTSAGPFIDSSVRGIGYTAGLSITYGLNCSAEGLLCNMGNMIAWPVLYKAGALIMKELQYSKRLNSVVTLHTKEHEALAQYYEGEYMQGMDNIIKRLVMPKDICFECRNTVSYQTIVP